MVLDVLFYDDCAENPYCLPAEWPAQVREMPDGSPDPAPPWRRMTLEEYNAYRADPVLLAAVEAAKAAAKRVSAERAERERAAQVPDPPGRNNEPAFTQLVETLLAELNDIRSMLQLPAKTMEEIAKPSKPKDDRRA